MFENLDEENANGKHFAQCNGRKKNVLHSTMAEKNLSDRKVIMHSINWFK